MPYGRYPERVKDFSKWSRTTIDKAKLSGSATAAKRRRRRRKKRKKKEDEDA